MADRITPLVKSVVPEVKLFAYGFPPTTRTASANPLRRLVWKVKRLKQLCRHRHNFGDSLSLVIVSALSRSRVRLAGQQEQGKLLAIGSILWSLQDQDVIWGSGAHREDQIPGCRIASCPAVRGPLTLQELIKAGVLPEGSQPLFFDPAILITLLYPGLRDLSPQKGRTLLIPHHSDVAGVAAWLKQAGVSLELVNPLEHPLRVAAKIAQSERVISSSLHGIILADALGVPVVPLRLEGNREPFFKYADYFQGTGRENPQCQTDIGCALDCHPSAFHYEESWLHRCLDSFPFPLAPLGRERGGAREAAGSR
jgi:pyruvyltransferase